MLKVLKKKLLLVFLFNFWITSYAQSPRLDYFDISNGLSQNFVFSLDIDQQGNIWAGTLDGLNRFNGHEFDVFKPIPQDSTSIKGNIVTAIYADDNTDIWASTSNGGLNHYDSKRKIFLHYTDSTVVNYFAEGFNNITITDNKNVWTQSVDYISEFDRATKTFNNYQTKNQIKGICNYTSNSILFYGEEGMQELQFKNNKVQISKSLITEPVYWVKNNDIGFHIALREGLLQFNSKLQVMDTLVSFKNIIGFPEAKHLSDIVVSKTEVWLATTKGLFKYPRNTKENFGAEKINIMSNTHYLKDRYITRLKIDAAGNLWIGTAKNGIAIYNNRKNLFQQIVLDKRLEPNFERGSISALCKSNSGDLWIGMISKGIIVRKKDGSAKSFTHYTNEKGQRKPLLDVRCIFQDSQQNIWIGNYDNISYYNKERDRIETLNYKYDWDWPYDCHVIKEFDKGKIILTGDKKIAIYDLNLGKLEFLPTGHNGVNLWAVIRDVEQDKYNNLWIAQNNYGLVKIERNPLHYTRLLKSNIALSDNKVYTMEVQGDSLWIASNTGLNVLNIKTNKVVKTYFQKNGLSSNVIYSVHLDAEKNLWMATNKGISKLETKNNQITTFLQNEFFSDDAYFYSEDNYVYYGDHTGITWFDPSTITDFMIESKPVIDEFALFNQIINVGDTIAGEVLLKNNLIYTSEIALNHEQNSFSFTFNSFPFDIPNNNTFRYRLKGVQKDWIYPKPGIRVASYTTIQPGNYSFETAVSSAPGTWSNPAQIRINISPPYWKTYWFRALLAIFVLGLIILFMRIRFAQIKRSKEVLEQRVEAQTKELKDQNSQILEISNKLHESDQAKLQFFTNISHEFRTPITLILGHLETLTKKTNSRQATIIRNNAERLLNLVNQLIEVRKMDQGQLRLNISVFDVISFVANIINTFKVLADQKEINLEFHTTLREQKIWLDKNKTEQILYNLISNAIKYTPPGEKIRVEVNTVAQNLVITVENNGIGIPNDKLEKIFDRFYRLQNHQKMGDGIGLALVKGLTERQEGVITVKSETDNITSFILKFKLGSEHFSTEDFGQSEMEELPDVEHQLFEGSSTANSEIFDFEVGQKLLIVEDNVELIDYITELLEKHFSIRTAPNGKIALEILENYMPDMIISDIMMPVMDGIRFCEEVKSKLITSHIPIILLTAKTDSETKIEGFQKGIDDYIEKPFKPAIFLARINAILTNRQKLKKHLIEHHKVDVVVQDSYSKQDKELWVNLHQILEDNFASLEFNTEELSAMLYMSRTTFYRKFKGLTGQSASDYLRKFRLKKAADLLYDDTLDIAQVSLNSGFKSLSQFRINFKETYGQTPSEFRKNR